MFKINSDVLKAVVSQLVKGARKTKLGESLIFIRTVDQEVSFYVNGEDISIEKKLPADIQGNLEVSTSVSEISTKVSALPSEEEILVQIEGNLLKMKWGRGSEISAVTMKETSPAIEIPELVEQVKWSAGSLHGLTRLIPPFTLNPNHAAAKDRAACLGPHIGLDADTGEVFVRATDSNKAVTVKAAKIEWFDGEPFTIETKTMQALADVLSEDSEISVGINKLRSLIVFKSGSTTAISRVLSGGFPDIDKVYLSDAKGKWYFDRLDLIDLCKRVRILTSTAGPIISFKVKAGKIHALVPNALDQQVSVNVDGDPCDFAINASNLEQAALLFQKSEEVVLYVNGSEQAMTLRAEGNEDVRVMLLPVRMR